MEGNNVEASACAPAGRTSARVGATGHDVASDTRGSIVRAYLQRLRSEDADGGKSRAPVTSMPIADAAGGMRPFLLEGVCP
jgi:hypothetical protein